MATRRNRSNHASSTVAGICELATAGELNTGTDDERVPSVDSLAGCVHGEKSFSLAAFESDTAVTVGDGTVPFLVPSSMDGMNIVEVGAGVHDKGVDGSMTIQVRRRRAGADVDVLNTALDIGDEFSDETTDINTTNDDLQTGDILYVDIDTIHTTTAANGLAVSVVARLP